MHPFISYRWFKSIGQETWDFAFAFCYQNSNRPYRDSLPCPAPHYFVPRLKKGITRRFYANPKARSCSSKGENFQVGAPRTTTTIFLFCFAHSHSRHCQLCNTTVPRSLPVTTHENNSRLNRASWVKRSAAVARFDNPPDLDVSGTSLVAS
jgi:hypothetical protein